MAHRHSVWHRVELLQSVSLLPSSGPCYSGKHEQMSIVEPKQTRRQWESK